MTFKYYMSTNLNSFVFRYIVNFVTLINRKLSKAIKVTYEYIVDIFGHLKYIIYHSLSYLCITINAT